MSLTRVAPIRTLTQQVLHLPPLLSADPHTAVRVGVPHNLKKNPSHNDKVKRLMSTASEVQWRQGAMDGWLHT